MHANKTMPVTTVIRKSKDKAKVGKRFRVVEKDVDSVVKTRLPWVHVVIRRCRSGIAAIHGEVDRQFLQLYLNEFCWKFNRRFFRNSCDPKYGLFDIIDLFFTKTPSEITVLNAATLSRYLR